jgi:Flp pilus assembly protein TadG
MKTWRMNNRGAALVEFALVALLLITLVIGIIDFGLLAKDKLSLGAAAREGVREAALGSIKADVEKAVYASAPKPKEGETLVVYMQYRTSAVGSEWTDYVQRSNIPTGSTNVQVKVKVVYRCNRISGTFLGNNPIELSTAEVRSSEEVF